MSERMAEDRKGLRAWNGGPAHAVRPPGGFRQGRGAPRQGKSQSRSGGHAPREIAGHRRVPFVAPQGAIIDRLTVDPSRPRTYYPPGTGSADHDWRSREMDSTSDMSRSGGASRSILRRNVPPRGSAARRTPADPPPPLPGPARNENPDADGPAARGPPLRRWQRTLKRARRASL